MKDSLHIAEPVALVRTRGVHRFEVISPKLKRRLTFYRQELVLLPTPVISSHRARVLER